MWIALIIMIAFFFVVLSNLLHSIFVMKYWGLSKKLISIINNEEDTKMIDTKAQRMFYALQVLSVLSAATATYFFLTLPDINEGPRVLFAFVINLPMWGNVLILVNALNTMRRAAAGIKFTLSRKQVALQLTVQILYALAYFLVFTVKPTKDAFKVIIFFYFFVIGLTGLMLIGILVHIADL